MSIEDRSFFIAAGKSLEQIEVWEKSVKAGLAAANVWRDEIGATEVSYCPRRGVNGMKFPEGKRLPGWSKYNRTGWDGWYYISDSKAGKDNRARAASIKPTPVPGYGHLAGAAPSGGTYWYESSLNKFGDKWIISQHKDVKDAPADAVPLKRSDYMKLVEESEEKSAA